MSSYNDSEIAVHHIKVLRKQTNYANQIHNCTKNKHCLHFACQFS